MGTDVLRANNECSPLAVRNVSIHILMNLGRLPKRFAEVWNEDNSRETIASSGDSFWNLDKYVIQFRQIHFRIQTNTIAQIHLVSWTNTLKKMYAEVWSKDIYIFIKWLLFITLLLFPLDDPIWWYCVGSIVQIRFHEYQKKDPTNLWKCSTKCICWCVLRLNTWGKENSSREW